MEYAFSWSWFFIGALIVAASSALFIWYQQIADAMAEGASSYDRFRLWGMIGIIVGFSVMLNLHTVILGWLFGSLFGR